MSFYVCWQHFHFIFKMKSFLLFTATIHSIFTISPFLLFIHFSLFSLFLLFIYFFKIPLYFLLFPFILLSILLSKSLYSIFGYGGYTQSSFVAGFSTRSIPPAWYRTRILWAQAQARFRRCLEYARRRLPVAVSLVFFRFGPLSPICWGIPVSHSGSAIHFIHMWHLSRVSLKPLPLWYIRHPENSPWLDVVFIITPHLLYRYDIDTRPPPHLELDFSQDSKCRAVKPRRWPCDISTLPQVFFEWNLNKISDSLTFYQFQHKSQCLFQVLPKGRLWLIFYS